MTQLTAEVQQRLDTEANIWLAGVRPDGRPHLTPVWFAWSTGKVYACIQATSVKTRNIEQNPHVSLALEDGSKVVICEGTAAFVAPPWPAEVAAIFRRKYDWDIMSDDTYDRLVAVTPLKWLVW
jgi:PPOX class probable F420-dependent enzyme